jgi:hypothetical protein
MTILDNVEYYLVNDYQIRAFRPLVDILPGSNKIVIDTSSISTEQIDRALDRVTATHDTVVLANVDVWVYYVLDDYIVNHPKLQNKNTYIATLGYDNVQLSDRCWRLSWPMWYFFKTLPEDRTFKPRAPGLAYHYGSLNNRPAPHRLLLGYHLMQRGLLNRIIYTQNNTSQQSEVAEKTYPPGEIDGFNLDYPQYELLGKLSNFSDYQRLLPIRWNYQPITNQHTVHHPAELETYCYILTEAMIEDPIWNESLCQLEYKNLPIMSEKTWRPFASDQVPLFLAARGHLAYVQSLGFELMLDLYPPDYDHLTSEEKVATIVSIVENSNMEDFYFSHLKELEHNHQLVFSRAVEHLVLDRIRACIR